MFRHIRQSVKIAVSINEQGEYKNKKSQNRAVCGFPKICEVYHISWYKCCTLKDRCTKRWDTGLDKQVLPLKQVISPFLWDGDYTRFPWPQPGTGRAACSCAMIALRPQGLIGRFECGIVIVSISTYRNGQLCFHK